MSGSTGLLGTALQQHFAGRYEVVPLLRGPARPGALLWDPEKSQIAPEQVSGFDAVIHLAGEPVVGLWTAARKQRIVRSRVHGTRLLAEALAAAPRPPKVFLCASGINIYGDCGQALVKESTPPGKGFLAEVCVRWEAAATETLGALCRVANLRIGVVLGRQGGALAPLLPLFRLGLGGTPADGSQYLSWISIDDFVRAVEHLLTGNLCGPVNLVAPQPVTGRHFTQALAAAVHRPALWRAPGWLLHAVGGQLAEETVLASVRAVPARLLEDGFSWKQGTIEQAFGSLHLRD